MTTLVLVIIVFAIVYIKKLNDVTLWFCLFVFLSSLGSYYNEKFQIANTVVVTDIGLLMFITSYIVNEIRNKNEIAIRRSTSYYYLIAVYMLLLGLIGGHPFGQILRDIKVFIYFFSAYVFCKKKKDDIYFVKCVFITMGTCVIFTIVVCAIDFFTYGINGIVTTAKIDRTFGLGLSQYGLAIVVVVVWGIMPALKHIWSRVLALGVEVLSLFLVLVSYTRSVWIQLIMGVALFVFFQISHSNMKTNLNQMIKSLFLIISFTTLLIIAWNYMKTNYTALARILIDRIESIFYIGSGITVNGNEDTLTYRINDIASYADKYNNIKIMFGWGFGDIKEGAVSGIVENSFFYYSWKYGIVLFALLIYKTINNIIKVLKRNTILNSSIAAGLTAYLISGSMSGHLNKYYMLPLVAILFVLDFDKYINYRYYDNVDT